MFSNKVFYKIGTSENTPIKVGHRTGTLHFPLLLLSEWPQSLSEEFLRFHKHRLQMIPLMQGDNCL